MITSSYPIPVSLICGIAGLALVFVSTILTLYTIISTALKSKKPSREKIYRDEDGVATEETMAKYSMTTSKIVIGISTFLELGVSIALAVLGTLHLSIDGFLLQDWLNAAASLLLAVQATCVVSSRLPVQTSDLGLYGAFSCSFMLVVIFAQDGLLVQELQSTGPIAAFVLRVLQLALVIVTGFANVSVPRRPGVFINGKPVDAMSTVSVLSKYTFTWCEYLLALAKKKGTLDLVDLPRPDHHTRSKDTTKDWVQANRKGRLWILIIRAHKWAFITQWSLTVVQAFGNFAPQFVLLKILQLLEVRQAGTAVTTEAWFWVVVLGLTVVVSAWIESWLFWVSQSEISIPVRAQLSALIFRKSMRRKDVKGASKSNKDDKKDTEEVEINPESGPNGETTAAPTSKEEAEEEDPNQKSRQATVNLIGVDAKRIADVCSINNFIPGSVFKLVVSFAFLLKLIGWQALLAGLGTMAVLTPVNIFFSKRYNASQDRLMKVRDVKLAVVNEALQGIKQIKWTATEEQWQAKIGRVRGRELKELWSSLVNDTGLFLCWTASPIMLSASSLAVYAYLHGGLSPSVAFTSIGIFKQLEVTLSVIPEMTTDIIDAYVSVKRIQAYLDAPEIAHIRQDASSVSFEDATVAWPSDNDENAEEERYILRNIDLSFPVNELSVISGKTGTGKSLLLSSILGETDLLSGKIHVPKAPSLEDRHDDKATKANWILPNSIAFVAQIPWIENATIKNNIIFGLPFDEERYNKTIDACALRKDLEMMVDGENTEIGANGVNLSGGQKWRLTFARALYSRAGILVLDDLFSALDAHVGRYIFENGLTGELGQGRTRILVTHHVALCTPRAKYLVELGDGTIEHAGLLSDLKEDGILTQIISHEETAKEIQEDEDTTAVNSEESSAHGDHNGDIAKKVDAKASAKKFVEEELREKGAIKRAIYADYLNSSGGFPFWTFACIIFLIQQALTIYRSWILRLWTDNAEEAGIHTFTYTLQIPQMKLLESANDDLMFYLCLYVGISVVTSILGTFRFFWMFMGSVKASRRLFDNMTFAVLRTPLRWIDTVPLGRILNRFTADFHTIDSRLAYCIAFGANSLFGLIGIIVAGAFVSLYIIPIALLLGVICLYFAIRYLNAARGVKRLESNAKSPIFETFNAALSGVATIRAFDKPQVYIERMYSLIDDHSGTFWHLWLFNRWMGFRMSAVGALFSVFVCTIILLAPSISAALAGFALAFSLEYTGAVIWTLRHYANLELDFNSAERVIEYCKLPIETQDGADPPAAWPSEGRLDVKDLVVGYAPDLPAVLKGLSFSIQRNERVGVVGRTGAGKSSLTLALFRFLEAREGTITIDGVDVSKIKLHALRSRLAIIPQDPVLFSGTVRSNLDPFDDHSDAELRDALQRVHLVSAPTSRDELIPSDPTTPIASGVATPSQSQNTNTNPFTSLSSPITEGGLNLSQGQRQLLCLARAIVSRPKIMVLDEATSAVDMATDALIQRSIREEFTDSTLIVIAHRLSTIGDFDKILVMDDGRMAEFGTPRELLLKEEEGEGEGEGEDGGKKAIFKGMVRESGERSKLEEIILGPKSGEWSGSS